MKNILHSSIFSRIGRLLLAGLTAAILPAANLRAQYVTTDVSNVLNSPYGVAVDGNNNAYIADTANDRIVEYNYSAQTVTTLAGLSGVGGSNNATGSLARLNQPQGVVFSPLRGGLVVVDQANQALRLVTLGGAVSTIPTTGVTFTYPKGIALGNDGVTLYVADQGANAIRVVSSNNVVSTLATSYTYYSYNATNTSTFRSPAAVAVDNNTNVWVTDSMNHVIVEIAHGGGATAIAGIYRQAGTTDSLFASNAQFNLPSGLFWDGSKQALLISDADNDTIRELFETNSSLAVQTLSGVPGQPGFVNGAPTSAEFFHPFGICQDPEDDGYFIVDGGNGALRVLQPTQPPPAPQPIANPVLGYVAFPILSSSSGPVADFIPFTSGTVEFNNAVDLAIEQNDVTVKTYYTVGNGTNISTPNTNSSLANAFVSSDDGLPENDVPSLGIVTQPALTMEAISTAPGRPSSEAVGVKVQFVTANPDIIGNNAASLALSNITVGAAMYYAVDNSTNQPTNDGSYGIGPIYSGAILTLNITSNTTLKVRAFASGFAPSATVSEPLTTNNFVGNQISFGFETGNSSSRFTTAAGRYYYAPVTLSLLPGAVMYSLQFDLTESSYNAAGSNAPILTNNWIFQSLLLYLSNNAFYPIPADIITGSGPVSGQFNVDDLMGISWITLYPAPDLYPTLNQDLVAYSEAHDQMFFGGSDQALLGAYSFPIPANAALNAQYELQIVEPSATTYNPASGVDAPQGVLVQAPVNGSLSNGAINSVKIVNVGVASYLVGDGYPFSWFNSGDFGDNDLQNDDVIEVYQTAVYGAGNLLGTSFVNSDYFDAMDSANAGYNFYGSDDSIINGMSNGDGQLNVNDVYVTLKRSLDTNLVWWIRNWSNGVETFAPTNYNIATPDRLRPAKDLVAKAAGSSQSGNGTPRYIAVGADVVQGAPNSTVQVPIRVLSADPTYPLRVLMFNVVLEPLDSSPSITSQISFSPASGLGSPTLNGSHAANNYNGAWLDSTVTGLGGTNIIGNLVITIPAGVPTSSSWLVHFTHFSASPNGVALFGINLQDGLVTAGNRTGSSWNDGIPDTWRLLWFNTIYNPSSAANLDPDGDGANNFQEYVAGTNPNDPTSVFKFLPVISKGASTFTMEWTSVAGKTYSVQSSPSITSGPWTTIVTKIPGTGQPIQWSDLNATGSRNFYRAVVQ